MAARRQIRGIAHAIVLTLGIAWASMPANGAPPPQDRLVRHDAPSGSEQGRITLYSTTDDDIAAPLITEFQRANPAIAVDFYNLDTLDLYNQVLTDVEERGRTADLLFSSAMDLQMKLVNDGFAHPYASRAATELPRWATWRNEAFGVTFEPAVIVYNRDLIDPAEVPRTRRDLAVLLETDPSRFHGKVASYDPRRSGVGFLFATQDAEHSDEIWRLARAFGQTGVKLYTSSASMLRRVASGQSLFAYNILGSYATTVAAREPSLGIILPEDYTLVMSRIALIPKAAANRRGGELFLDWLLSPDGQRVIADKSFLYSIHPGVEGAATARSLQTQAGDRLRPIPVAPGVMVYLDRAKRQRFLKRFERVLQGQDPTAGDRNRQTKIELKTGNDPKPQEAYRP